MAKKKKINNELKLTNKLAKKFYLTKKRKNAISRRKLVDIQADANKIFEVANRRWGTLENLGYYTSAMDDAKKATGHNYFGHFTNKRVTKMQLVREMFAAVNFLNSYYSTPEGGEIESRKLRSSEYEGAFGSNWYSQKGVGYNTDVIDPDAASVAFEIFRNIERQQAVFLYGNQKSKLDSAQLIRDIYSIVVENNLVTNRDETNRHLRSDFIMRGVEEVNKLVQYYKDLSAPEDADGYYADFQRANIILGRNF